MFTGERESPTIVAKIEDGNLAISPFSLVPKVTSKHFAIIVTVLLNQFNRHTNGLVQPINKKSNSSIMSFIYRLKRVNILVYDALRCLLKDVLIQALITGGVN